MAFVIQIEGNKSAAPYLACDNCNEPIKSAQDVTVLWFPQSPLLGADEKEQSPRVVFAQLLCKRICFRKQADLWDVMGQSYDYRTIGLAEFLELWREGGVMESYDRRAARRRLEMLGALIESEKKA